MRAWTAAVAGAIGMLAASPANAQENDVLLEFHFQPVPHAQIAVWMEDADGNHIDTVYACYQGCVPLNNSPVQYLPISRLLFWRYCFAGESSRSSV